MVYGIRLANGEVQLLTETSALTNEQTDGLLGGGAEVVWIDAQGRQRPIALFHEVPELDESPRENPS